MGKTLLFFAFLTIFGCKTVLPEEILDDEYKRIYDVLYGRNIPKEDIRKAGAEITLAYMNLEADPCEDFYNYSCGNWQTVNPGHETTIHFLNAMLTESVKTILLEDFEYGPEDADDSFFTEDDKLRNGYIEAEKQAKNFYKSCMNTELIKESGIQSGLDLINSFGGWCLGEWHENYDWVNLTAQLQILGENVFLSQKIGMNYASFTYKEITELDPGKFIINVTALSDKDIEVRVKTKTEFQKHVEGVLKLFHVNADEAESIAIKITDFESLLAKIPSESGWSGWSRGEINISDFQNEIPTFNITKYLSVLQDTDEPSETVYVRSLEYYHDLNSIFANTPNETLWNYAMFRLCLWLLPIVDTSEGWNLHLKHFKFRPSRLVFKYDDRSDFCLNKLESEHRAILSSIVLRKYITKSAEEDVQVMANIIDGQFLSLLENTEELDDTIKEFLIEKASNISLSIGIEDKESIVKFKDNAPSYSFDPDASILHNMLIFQKEKKVQNIKKLKGEYRQEVYFPNYLTTNAFYSGYDLSRTLLPGMLIPPNYNKDFPRYINYGKLGTITGHELVHGFDFRNIWGMNRYGKRFPMKFDTVLKYFWKTLCIVRLYNSLEIEGSDQHIDGLRTMGENFSDLGGLTISYAAYQKWLQENEELAKGEIAENSNLTSKQLYFVSFMQNFCEKKKELDDRDSHSPMHLRGTGALLNFPDFAKEFQCAKGSAMNPERKCNFY